MNVFFASKSGENFFLDEKETHHCLHVLRKKDNDKIYFINGDGELWEGVIEVINNKTIKIIQPILLKKNTSPLPYVHIAIAPTKQFQRMEWFLEKAVECGVNEISFIKTKRTERYHIFDDRCKYIIRNAMKQSLMLYEPKFNSEINFDSLVKDTLNLANTYKGICHQNENADFVGNIGIYSNYIFLIGPEGDFTKDEVQFAIDNDFHEIHLGNNRLRTETAGLYSIISVRSRYK